MRWKSHIWQLPLQPWFFYCCETYFFDRWFKREKCSCGLLHLTHFEHPVHFLQCREKGENTFWCYRIFRRVHAHACNTNDIFGIFKYHFDLFWLNKIFFKCWINVEKQQVCNDRVAVLRVGIKHAYSFSAVTIGACNCRISKKLGNLIILCKAYAFE